MSELLFSMSPYKKYVCQYNGTKGKVVILDFQKTPSLLHPWRRQLFTTYITYTIYTIYTTYITYATYITCTTYTTYFQHIIFTTYIYVYMYIHIYYIYINWERAHQRSSLDQTKILKAQTIYISIILAYISIICIYVISFILSKYFILHIIYY